MLQDPTKLSGAPLVSHLRKLYRKGDAKQTVRKPDPERELERATTPETLLPPHGPPYGPLPLPLPVFKPSKRTKVANKAAGKTTTSTRRPAALEDLSDVSLDR